MRLRLVPVLVVLCLTMTPIASSSQATDPTITFTMPLNLMNISSDIEKIAVYCRIQSAAILTRDNRVWAQVEFLVKSGQVTDNTFQQVTSATVQVKATSLDANALGKPASYECILSGFSTSLQRWDTFQESHTVAAFRLTPTPPSLTGSFVW